MSEKDINTKTTSNKKTKTAGASKKSVKKSPSTSQKRADKKVPKKTTATKAKKTSPKVSENLIKEKEEKIMAELPEEKEETKVADSDLEAEVFEVEELIEEPSVEINNDSLEEAKMVEETPEQIDVQDFRDDIDSKKEFFRLMAEKIKEDANFEAESETIQDRRPVRTKHSYYKRSLWRYLFLVLILVLAVSYFSLSRLDLVVYTNKEAIKDSLSFYAHSSTTQNASEHSLPASFSKVDLDLNDTFPSSGKKSSGGEIVGKVKIINNYSKNQPLVATTRLLSSDNKLFRIKNTVNVPAGSSIEVPIYADTNSADMAIGPDKFTIPGLWEGLQDKIYAESSLKFEFKEDAKGFITQNDIDNAISLLNEKMVKEAEQEAAKISGGQKNILNLDKDSVQVEIDKKVGDEAENFNLRIKSSIDIISLNNTDVINLIKNKLDILKSNQGSLELDATSLSYSLLNYNQEKALAEINVNFSAKGSLIGDNGAGINKKHLLNLNERQIRSYLNGISGLKSYDLFFRPSFIKRAPMLVDRINITYK